MPPSHLPAGTAGLAAHVRAAVALPAGPRPAVQPRMAPPAVQPSRPPAPPRLAPPPLARPPAPAKVPAPPLPAPPSRVAQACPDKGGASCGCGGGGGGCGDGKLPAALARRIETLAHGADPLSSQQAFDSALPGLIQEAVAMGVGRPKAQGRSCGGRCGHGAAASVQAAPAPGGPAAVLQRAQCNRGAGAQEWYTKTGAQVRAYFQHNYGMDVRSDVAHVLCCAFCEAFIRSWVTGGAVIGARYLRYTALFENYVHQYHAAYAAPAGGRAIFTEEVYWVPHHVANFGNAIGLGAAAHQDAYVFDNVLWAQIKAVIDAVVMPGGMILGAGVYPTGMPGGIQGAFDALRAAYAAEAVPAAPANPQRRSYAGAFVRGRAIYGLLKLISENAATAAGTQWDGLRALRGRMRILDFTGTSGVGNAPAVIDAKFSYIGNDDNGTNRFDNWGPGQAADQLTIYQSLAAGVAAPAHGVPIATNHACGCNAQLLKDMLFAKMAKKLLESQGKRNAGKRAERARDDYGRMTKASRFISSADVKYVK